MKPLELVRTYPVTVQTPDFALDPQRRRLYVLDAYAPFRERAILTFDLDAPATASPRRLETPVEKAHILPKCYATVQPFTGNLWVTVWSSESPTKEVSPLAGIEVWEMDRQERVAFFSETSFGGKWSSRSRRIVFREREPLAIVSLQGYVAFFGTTPPALQQTLPLPGEAGDQSHFVVDETTGRGFLSRDNQLAIVDLTRRAYQVNFTIETPATRRFPQGKHAALDIALDSRTGRLFLAYDWPRAEVAVVDSRRLRVLASLPVGERPLNLALDEQLRRLYVANGHGGDLGSTLQIFHIDTLASLGTVTLDWRLGLDDPGRIVVDPITHEVYIAMLTTGKIAVFRPS